MPMHVHILSHMLQVLSESAFGSSGGNSGNNAGVIVGCIFGIALLVLAVILAVLLIRKKKQRDQANTLKPASHNTASHDASVSMLQAQKENGSGAQTYDVCYKATPPGHADAAEPTYVVESFPEGNPQDTKSGMDDRAHPNVEGLVYADLNVNTNTTDVGAGDEIINTSEPTVYAAIQRD